MTKERMYSLANHCQAFLHQLNYGINDNDKSCCVQRRGACTPNVGSISPRRVFLENIFDFTGSGNVFFSYWACEKRLTVAVGTTRVLVESIATSGVQVGKYARLGLDFDTKWQSNWQFSCWGTCKQNFLMARKTNQEGKLSSLDKSSVKLPLLRQWLIKAD